jgi:hypothetical protein
VAIHVEQNVRSVFAPVVALSFSATQMDDCRNFLANRTAHTECVPVVDEAQLLMSSTGRLVETGYRFNVIGFDALARVLSGGLAALFSELSGELTRGTLKDERPFDLAAAVSIYNTTLQIRFEAVREKSLLINHNEKAIEGFLGLEHRLLDNTIFFDTVQREMADKQPQAEFSRAEVIGRELRIYYIDPESRRVNIHPDPRHAFASGWYFANREDSGNAIKATTCIFTKFGAAIEPMTQGSKIVHTGSDLLGRTALLVSRTAARTVDMDKIAKQVRHMLATPLQFTDNRAQFEEKIRHWAYYISRFKVRYELARTISRHAATTGADIDPRDPTEIWTNESLGSRTVYDLLCSILRQSRQEYATYRDLLQGMAMRLLIPDAFGKK